MEKVGNEKAIQGFKKNLGSKEYKNVDEEYGRQLIKVVTTEQSKKDLANYHNVRTLAAFEGRVDVHLTLNLGLKQPLPNKVSR